jgi:hypothetical protein
MGEVADVKRVVDFLDMMEEEFEEINKLQEKLGSTKAVARRMLFFVGGVMFNCQVLKVAEVLDKLEYPDKDLIKFRIESILKLCREKKNDLFG